MGPALARKTARTEIRGEFGSPTSTRPKNLIDCTILILEKSSWAHDNKGGAFKSVLGDTQNADLFRCGGQDVFHTEKLARGTAEATRYDIVVFTFCPSWVQRYIARVRKDNPNVYVVVWAYKSKYGSQQDEKLPEGVADLLIRSESHALDKREVLRAMGQMIQKPPLTAQKEPQQAPK